MEEAGFTTGKKIVAEVREKGEVVVRMVEEEELIEAFRREGFFLPLFELVLEGGILLCTIIIGVDTGRAVTLEHITFGFGSLIL